MTFKAIYEFEKIWKEKPKFSKHYDYARFLTHIAKNRTVELSIKSTLLAREIFGGFGFLNESPIERLHREALVTPIFKISNFQKLNEIESYYKNFLKLSNYQKQYYAKELLNKFVEFIESTYEDNFFIN